MLPNIPYRPINIYKWYSLEHLLVFQCTISNDSTYHNQLESRWQTLENLHDTLLETNTLLPLIYEQLNESGVNSSLKDGLRGVYRKTWVHNQLTIKNIKSIASLLDSQQIDYAFCGDFTLTQQLYDTVQSRRMGQTRLIVHDTNLQSVLALIKQISPDINWTPMKPHYIRQGQVWRGGSQPSYIIANGIAQKDDLSTWEKTQINGIWVMKSPALAYNSVAHTVGFTPPAIQLIDLLFAIRKMNEANLHILTEHFSDMELLYPYRQMLIFLHQVLDLELPQTLVSNIIRTDKHYQYLVHYLLRRIQYKFGL